ncbi:MAG: hypothetical protein ACI9QC_000468 [Oceanicoccus sp.]|jgi:hypothetical protein
MNTPQDQSAQSGTKTSGANAADYKIPAVVQEKFAELVKLILATESMSKEERNYWFQILPIMTPEQIERLNGILHEEKSQLAKLDSDYQDELGKLNKKHLQEWDEFERKQDRDDLKAKEAASEVEEANAEENILGELDGL